MNPENPPTPSVDQHRLVQRELTKSLIRITHTGTPAFWSLALYRYIGEVVESEKKGPIPRIPYDNTDYNELASSGARSNNRILRNLIEISKSRTHRKTRFPGILTRIFVAQYCIEYGIFRLLHFMRRKKIRENLKQIAAGAHDPFIGRAFDSLPKCYAEDVRFFYGKPVESKRDATKKELKDGFCVAYASRHDFGLQIELAQHGAFYGELHDHTGTAIEAQLPVIYYTWGWVYESNQIPVTEPRQLESFKNDYERSKKATENLLLVLPSKIDDQQLIVLSKVMNEVGEIAKQNGLKVLLRARSPKEQAAKEQLHVMLRGSVGGDWEFDHFANAAESAKNSKVMICTSHPATLFLQGLYVGHPVIAITDSRRKYHWRYQTWVSDLNEAGLLLFEAEGFLPALRANLARLEGWWKEVNENEKVLAYKRKYCAFGG